MLCSRRFVYLTLIEFLIILIVITVNAQAADSKLDASGQQHETSSVLQGDHEPKFNAQQAITAFSAISFLQKIMNMLTTSIGLAKKDPVLTDVIAPEFIQKALTKLVGSGHGSKDSSDSGESGDKEDSKKPVKLVGSGHGSKDSSDSGESGDKEDSKKPVKLVGSGHGSKDSSDSGESGDEEESRTVVDEATERLKEQIYLTEEQAKELDSILQPSQRYTTSSEDSPWWADKECISLTWKVVTWRTNAWKDSDDWENEIKSKEHSCRATQQIMGEQEIEICNSHLNRNQFLIERESYDEDIREKVVNFKVERHSDGKLSLRYWEIRAYRDVDTKLVKFHAAEFITFPYSHPPIRESEATSKAVSIAFGAENSGGSSTSSNALPGPATIHFPPGADVPSYTIFLTPREPWTGYYRPMPYKPMPFLSEIGKDENNKKTHERLFPVHATAGEAVMVNAVDDGIDPPTDDRRSGSPFAYGVCAHKRQVEAPSSSSTEISSENSREDEYKRQLFGHYYHHCGADEYMYLHHYVTNSKNKQEMEVFLAVADGVGSPKTGGRDPGWLTLSMMSFLRNFISLYPGWSPLQYLTVLAMVYTDLGLLTSSARSHLVARRRYESLFNFLSKFNKNDVSSQDNEAYYRAITQGSSTLSIFSYNMVTGAISYANVGDSRFIVLRRNEINGYYKTVFETNTGVIMPNLPHQLGFRKYDRQIFITRMHLDQEKKRRVTLGRVIPPLSETLEDWAGTAEHYLALQKKHEEQKQSRKIHAVLVNTLPKSTSVLRLQKGDVVIGGSDGLFDNFHLEEIEAIATIAVSKYETETKSTEVSLELNSIIAQTLMMHAWRQSHPTTAERPGVSAQELRRRHLNSLNEELDRLSKGNEKLDVDKLERIPFRNSGNEVKYVKIDDTTIVVSVKFR